MGFPSALTRELRNNLLRRCPPHEYGSFHAIRELVFSMATRQRRRYGRSADACRMGSHIRVLESSGASPPWGCSSSFSRRSQRSRRGNQKDFAASPAGGLMRAPPDQTTVLLRRRFCSAGPTTSPLDIRLWRPVTARFKAPARAADRIEGRHYCFRASKRTMRSCFSSRLTLVCCQSPISRVSW